MKVVELDPTKYYYNIDGRLVEFNSSAEANKWFATHRYGYFLLFREPKKVTDSPVRE
jgi:hypothetical protein